MADQHPRVSTPIGSRSAVRRHLRSSSQSPSRHQPRIGDDLLSQLSPHAAVDALRSPTGPLKICMDRASASEQAFAMRTAIASKKIRDWLDELSSWPWPKENGSTGFEMPPSKRRKLFEPDTTQDRKEKSSESDLPFDTDYLGSLRAADVDRYELRVEQIQQDLDDLDLEEIKNQVLHNHILPLSRPNTPFEGDRSATPGLTLAKMEDLTAAVTAITVQALPNLSKLSRLLNTWTVRLLVLRKVPSVLVMIEDAEVALRSGWSVIASDESGLTKPSGQDGTKEKRPKLSKQEFDVMKRVLQQKVTKPGRALDYMLDTLEGSMDTLPDEWLDRMEEVERDYAIWETTAERQVLAGEKSNNVSRTEPETPRLKIQVHGPSPTKDLPEESDANQFASPPTPSDYSPEVTPSKGPITSHPVLLKRALGGPSQRGAVKFAVNEPTKKSVPQTNNSSRRITMVHVRSGQYHPRLPPLGRQLEKTSNAQATRSGETSPVLGEVDQNIIRNPPQESKKLGVNDKESAVDDDIESSVLEPSILEPVDEEGEDLELPPARLRERRSSGGSLASTVIHGPPTGLFGRSDDMLSREGSMEPDLPRLADPDEPFSSDAISPPSSPPLRYKTRSTSVTFKDVPDIATLPEADSTPPRSPLEPPELFDADTSFDNDSLLGSPGRMSTVSSLSEDEHLHQQISELLETIPAKIRFKRTPGVNLNPPDFQLPPRPKSRTDNTRRSNSSLSSRAGTPFSRSGTPSFMLAPARDGRPRTKSSQGIRVYHLSRPTGEPPLKLLVRCVGEHGERVMVRIGGGWADLGEYLREYALHHSSRSKGEGKVDIRDLPAVPSGLGSSPSSRPGSALDTPATPLVVRKTRKSLGEEGAPRYPKTPLSNARQEEDTPPSESSARSRASSRMDWDEEDSALGLAGPKGKKVDMSDESRAWVESVKEKVRIASGERVAPPDQRLDTKFGEIGKVGGTKRLFRKN
ncbi:uncharacterized protein F4822DRAFT_436602 [Hypoxylon trugodes]|uniref:uncharacterized protein n=1 Tax=Hypoxylon trugodes TaxID=326681 RepID=UPI00218FEAF7|nr:uncharacterized protein F4822DRAFT_436602 [Hypoxylon trugodes]KAI1391029.1 hypothetical protein F4822DRAFT_436602 [Hypoxylon trugodes]